MLLQVWWKKVQPWLRTGEPYSLSGVIIYRETGWMLLQHRNNLFCPEVLNSSTEFGLERKFRTVGVNSVIYNVLAVCLYSHSVYNKR
jgi:hypothetical protein